MPPDHGVGHNVGEEHITDDKGNGAGETPQIVPVSR